MMWILRASVDGMGRYAIEMLYEAGGGGALVSFDAQSKLLGQEKRICIFLIMWDTEEGLPPDKSGHMAPKEHPTGENIKLG